MNYVIEGNINFYDELYKLLDKDEVETEIEANNNFCLITNLPLTETHIKLVCGHTFNYEPLFNDISIHKKKHNTMERLMLKANQLRCPYCRNIQDTLLPKIDGFPDVHGVNFIDTSLIVKPYNSDCYGVCCYESQTVDGVAITCTSKYGKLFTENNKFYCWKHHNVMTKNLIKEKTKKMKLAEKKVKILAKEKAKLEKQLEKKLEKQLKNEKKKLETNVENTILSPSSLPSTTVTTLTVSSSTCNHILQTGPNKGSPCGKKNCAQENYCKAHYLKYK